MTKTEKEAVIQEFFYAIRGAQLTHIMTGDFYYASGRSKSYDTDDISFTADTPSDAAAGALEQWRQKQLTSHQENQG